MVKLSDLSLRDNDSTGVAIATLAVFFVLTLATFIQPLLHFPDESFHIDMIFAATDGDGYPEVGTRSLSPRLAAANSLLRVNRTREEPLPPRLGGRGESAPCTMRSGNLNCSVKPTFEEMEEAAVEPGPTNRMTQHPPLYYLAVGQTVATITSLTMHTVPYDGQIWLYRIVSAALVAAMSFVTGTALRRFGFARHVQISGALAPALLPGLVMRSGALVSNDALLYPLISGILLLMVKIYVSGTTRKRLIGIGVFLGLSILTKGTAILVAASIPFSLLLLQDPVGSVRTRVRHATKATLVVAGTSICFGGWWILRNLVVYGALQPAGFRRPDADPSFSPDLTTWLSGYFSGVVRTSLGAPGRQVLDSPAWVIVASIVIVAVLVLGVKRIGWRPSLALNLPLILIFVGWSTNAYLSYLRTGQVVAWNARYYFAAMLGLYVLVAVGVDAIVRRLMRLPRTAVPAAILALGVLAVYLDVRFWVFRYWATQDTWGAGWRNLAEWAPAPFAIALAAMLASVIAGSISVLSCARQRPTVLGSSFR